MSTSTGHGPVRRWRSGWLRVRCRCGDEAYPCPTVRAAQRRWREALDEAHDWQAEQRRAFTESIDNWWENPR
jgi:hypothetical protein